MDVDQTIAFVERQGGVLTLRPRPGDGSPAVSWGDAFLYYAPDGVVPRTQPFATVVTKDYPGEPPAGLDRPGAFRVNIAAGAAEFRRRLGYGPEERPVPDVDPAAPDVLMPHPVYGRQGWLAVVDPAARTEEAVRELLRIAHHLARERYERRRRHGPPEMSQS